MALSRPRVAIVHERFTELGGSEAVVAEMRSLYPDAIVRAPIIDHRAVPAGLDGADLQDSFLRLLYRGGTRYAHLLPLLPLAIRSLDVTGVDVVVASHHAFANRVRPPRGVPLVSYTHTPARWIWDSSKRAGEAGGLFGAAGLAAFAATQRQPDRRAAARAERIASNSRAVAARVRSWWGREAAVIHPPARVEWFTPETATQREDFFLFAGRLVPYKGPDVAIAAAAEAGVRLVVAGGGRMQAQLQGRAGRNVEFLGRVDDEMLRELFRRCRAVVMPGEEDFGLVPIEAQACGAPVVALAAGGSLDTVVEDVTGVLYRPTAPGDEVGALARALRAFEHGGYDPARVRAHAESFSRARFRARLQRFVEDAWRSAA